jgi:hypothetical protein
VELTLAEIKAKIAELQDAAVEIRKSGIQKIVDLIHQVAADNEVHPTHVLADIKKEIGEPLVQQNATSSKIKPKDGQTKPKGTVAGKIKGSRYQLRCQLQRCPVKRTCREAQSVKDGEESGRGPHRFLNRLNTVRDSAKAPVRCCCQRWSKSAEFWRSAFSRPGKLFRVASERRPVAGSRRGCGLMQFGGAYPLRGIGATCWGISAANFTRSHRQKYQ